MHFPAPSALPRPHRRPHLNVFVQLCVGVGLHLFSFPALSAQPAKEKPSFDFLYGYRELYPSALVCMTADSDKAPRDPDQLGDPRGVISVRLRTPHDHCRVRVTFTETSLYEESHVEETLPTAGEVVRIAPMLRFRTDVLSAIKQPIANLVVHAVVEWPGQTHHLTERIVVHSINDAIMSYRSRLENGQLGSWESDAKYFIAAYVNENHPWVDQCITRHALRGKDVARLAGYRGTPAEVEQEVRSLFETLRTFGFKYSLFPNPSTPPVSPGAQSVIRLQGIRLLGDTLLSAQANATETALVLASVLRKMGIDPVLFLLPEPRTLLGVYLAPQQNPASLLILDPRELGLGDFDAAKRAGAAAFTSEVRAQLIFPPDDEGEINRAQAEQRRYFAIDIAQARLNGILPIPDLRNAPPPAFP